MMRWIETHVSLSVRAGLALFGAVLLWSSSFIALKVAVAAFDPMVMVFGRMVSSLAALVLLRLTVWRRSAAPLLLDRRVTRREWKYVILLALCEPCFYFVFEGHAMVYTTASQAGMVVAALPLAVVVAAWLALGERPHPRVWAGFALAVIGVVWLSAGAEVTESAPNPVFGNILEALAMLCGAFYVICAKQLSSRCSPVFITAVQSVVGFFFFLPLLALPMIPLPDHFPLLPTLAVLYLGVGVTMLSFLLYNFAVRTVPASRTGAFLNLVPVLTLLMGMLFLDERLTPGQWVASALVLGGVVLSQWKTERAPDAQPVGSVRAGARQGGAQPMEDGAGGGGCGLRHGAGKRMTAAGLPELLVPAGGREQFEAALLYGADAVYMGGPELSLRTACEGFSHAELVAAVREAHARGVRVYYCLNALPYDAQLPAVEAALERLPESGVDGLIAADPGVIWLARRRCPSVPLHLSTQAHSVNAAAVAFWREAGVSRVNLARELSFRDMRALAQTFPDMEFEAFVHGAMCLALSGHCLLSAWVNGRPANQGRCTQPCRFDYRAFGLVVEEQKRKGEPLWEVRQGEAFSGFWAPQDLCLLRYVGCLADSGIAALKLEGRTKSGGYVAQVTDAYSTALHRHASRQAGRVSPPEWTTDAFLEELFQASTRPLSSGFFLPRRRVEVPPAGFAARPVAARLIEPRRRGWKVQVRSVWRADREAVVLFPGLRRPALRPGTYGLENHRGERVDILHPGMEGVLHCEMEWLRAGLYIRA